MEPLQPLAVPCTGLRLIEASAGTGKTYTIASLYLRLLLERKLSVRQILVVTYTVAATEELRDRLRARLREALQVLQGATTDDEQLKAQLARIDEPLDAITRLQDELTCIDEAAVFTIHGFCQRMLQENAFESGTLFDAELLEDERELIAEIVEDFWRCTFHLASNGFAALAAEQFATPAQLYDAIRNYITKPDLSVQPEVNAVAVDERAFAELHGRAAKLWSKERDEIVSLIDGCKDLSRGPYKTEKVAFAAEALDQFFASAPESYATPYGLELFAASHLDASITPAKKKKGAQPPQHTFFAACGELMELRARRRYRLLHDAIDHVRAERIKRKATRGLLAFDDLLTQLRAALEAPQGNVLAQRIAERFPVALIDEFQDTDPEQYRIFSSIYRNDERTALFMIGDPKQAIYSFRGADVFTYMGAKEDTAKDGRYTLDTNWRSSKALVDGVNALFRDAAAPFIYSGHIDFHAVNAAGKADKEPLQIKGDEGAPLHLWFVPATEENSKKEVVMSGWLKERLPEFCAEEIVRLLNLGAEGDARIGDEPVQPRHIAVLVRNRREAAAVQKALRARRVNSAYYGRESVYETEEAEELERLLLAFAEPTREAPLRAALCSRLWGMNGNALAQLQQNEEAWEEIVLRVQGYHTLWMQQGFMAMFRTWLHDHAVAARLLAAEDGERRVTNLLQLGELLQQASREHHGIERLLRWFAEQRVTPNGDSEEQQLRLESDDELVKIVTIHKSKGLEYPIVFLPSAWEARPLKEGPVLFHDEVTRRPVVDLAGSPEAYALAEKERLAEEVRLLYVALTRAKYRCYIAWGKFYGAENGALAWLLHGQSDFGVEQLAGCFKECDEAALRARVEQWKHSAPNSITIAAPPRVTNALFTGTTSITTARAARTPARKVTWDWRVTSYTALTAGHGDERPDYGSASEDAEAPVAAPRLSLLDFPRGSRAGTFMHRLLERIDFPTACGESLVEIIDRELARSGYGLEWRGAMEEMVANVLDTPLAPGLRLRDVTEQRRLIELEFHYPLRHLHAADLERVAAGLGEYRPESPTLHFGTINGVMRGFIDLIFEHEGRYYIADYKSNYLGPRREDYGGNALREAVRSHRYDLQYLIYTVALHRYLRQRIRGYDYEHHFGGVFYLFLRGMSPAQGGLGVYADRPALEKVEALDALFEGREP